jgi:Gpi18-like mannosyltransferase
VYVLLALPACVAGRSFLDLLLLYASQKILPFPALTLGATNLYQWLPGVPFEPFFKAGLALATVSAVAFMIALARRFPDGLSSPVLGQAALLSLVLMPFVLPAMHERYFFAADALAVAYGFTVRGRWIVAALIQFASAFTYLPYLFNVEPVPRPVLAAVMGVALGRLLWELLATLSPALSHRMGAGVRAVAGASEGRRSAGEGERRG